ncbi:MAG: hypothetical protein ACXVRM_03135 [Solirubrobacteraceae bacterium]
MFRCVARIAAAAVCAALLCVPAAQAQVQPYGTSDYGGFRNVLPPGTNGFDDAAQLVQFEATGARPAHSDDQLAMYSNLTTAAGSITPATVPDYYRRLRHSGAPRRAGHSSLAAAAAETPDQMYRAAGPCQAGDQECPDSIQFRAIGTITQPLIPWVNRPTFQQADEIQGHGPG